MKLRDGILFIAAGIFLAVYLISNIISISTDSYRIAKQDLIKIDTVKILSRAYKIEGKSSIIGYEFEDEQGREFKVTDECFNAVVDKKLYDTLQYSNTELAVLTTKEGYAKYISNRKTVPVYDIIIDGRSYIDIALVNEKKYSKLVNKFVISAILFLIFLAVYINYRVNK